MKASIGFAGQNYLLSMTDNPPSFLRQYFAILLESNNILSCYPSLMSNSSLKVKYTDFAKDSRTWSHIACTYDNSSLQVIGNLY
jgi:hypothetical protein